MSFYIALPSNSSMDLYPSNTMTDFNVQLIEPIRLDTKYEVALVVLTYKHSWSINVGKLTIHDLDTIEYYNFDLIYHDGENISSFANRLNSEILEFFIKMFCQIQNYLKIYEFHLHIMIV